MKHGHVGRPGRYEIDVPRKYRTRDMSQNIEVGNGDTIFVQRAPVFCFYGEVQRAGAYWLEPAVAHRPAAISS